MTSNVVCSLLSSRRTVSNRASDHLVELQLLNSVAINSGLCGVITALEAADTSDFPIQTVPFSSAGGNVEGAITVFSDTLYSFVEAQSHSGPFFAIGASQLIILP